MLDNIVTLHTEKELLNQLKSFELKDKLVLVTFNTKTVPLTAQVSAEIYRLLVKHRPHLVHVKVEAEGHLPDFKTFNINHLPIVFLYRNNEMIHEPLVEHFEDNNLEQRIENFLTL